MIFVTEFLSNTGLITRWNGINCSTTVLFQSANCYFSRKGLYGTISCKKRINWYLKLFGAMNAISVNYLMTTVLFRRLISYIIIVVQCNNFTSFCFRHGICKIKEFSCTDKPWLFEKISRNIAQDVKIPNKFKSILSS